jgi:hypothetical protein
MEGKKRARTVGLVLLGLVVGYLIGPPIVQAAAQLVVIKDSSSSAKARVSSGRLRVDTEASALPDGLGATGIVSLTEPLGMELFATGTGATTAVPSGQATISSILVDGPATGTYSISITANHDCDGGTTPVQTIWQGSANDGAHLFDSFEGGLFVCAPVAVTQTGTGAGRWALYGDDFDSVLGRPAKSLRG